MVNRYDVPHTEIVNKPFCQGILKFAKKEMTETPEWFTDAGFKLRKPEAKSSLSEKVTEAMMVMTIHTEMNILRHLDKNFIDPDRADLGAAGVAIGVASLISENLRGLIQSEEVRCSQDTTERFASICMTPFPLFPDDKKKQIITIGLRFLKTIAESDHQTAIEIKDNIQTLIVGYVLNQNETKMENKQFVDAFCSIAEIIHKSIEYKGQ